MSIHNGPVVLMCDICHKKLDTGEYTASEARIEAERLFGWYSNEFAGIDYCRVCRETDAISRTSRPVIAPDKLYQNRPVRR